MKKYFLLFSVLVFIPVFLLGQSITMNKIAMHGPGGVTDQEVSYGETINAKAEYTSSNVPSVDNVFTTTTSSGRGYVYLFYYDSSDPSTGNYLGSSTVSVSNLTGLATGTDIECTFDFVLPAYFGTGSAYSVQICFGMYSVYHGFGFYGDRRSSYINQVPFTACTASYTNWFEYLKGVNDGPLPVTLSTFTVEFMYGKPALYWTTQSETNNEGWNVYKSEGNDPLLNETIQLNSELIQGQGTTTEPTHYVFIDEFPVEENQTYWYMLESITYDGLTEVYHPVSLTVPEEGDDPGTPDIINQFGLIQNYPNPFNPYTEIWFEIENDSYVELSIFNTKGQKIRTIFTGNVEGETEHNVLWNGTNESGKDVVSGIYLYKLKTEYKTFTKKMLLVK